MIEELKKYDNEEGYKLEYKEVERRLRPVVNKLIEKGEDALGFLHQLLQHEETWSCLFTLIILKEIKSPKSIPYLIDFIRNNENGDYWENCEDAMNALIAIGKPAVKPLLKEVKKDFEKKSYLAFLVGALTGIKDENVYTFCFSIMD